MDFFFYKKHSQLFRMKIHGSMILMGWFSFLMEHLTQAVFYLLTLVKTSLVLNKQKPDKAGRILILDVMLHRGQYILINFFGINQNKRITFASDFNFFFIAKLEARGGKPLRK